MKTNYKTYILTFSFILSITWIMSCSGRPSDKTIRHNTGSNLIDENKEPAFQPITLKQPENNTAYKLGDEINILIGIKSGNNVPDSIGIYYDGKKVTVLFSEPWQYTIPSTYNIKTGKKALRVAAYRNGKPKTAITHFVTFFSDKKPDLYGYKVMNSYPHDRNAFTQGLFFDQGFLYESTGQETKSTLRKVDLKTGNIQNQLNLNNDLFGEGITLYNERIYQITWTSKTGFVYDKNTFKLVNRIFYYTQGWGLTTMGDKIVMSDGSNNIYFLDPESFIQTSKIEVYDNKKKVDQLNELEYINGKIWANIWNTDLIAIINPESGIVESYINLKNIMNEPGFDTNTNVLNGIAYDKENNRIFITGKNWPKLFEIQIIGQ